MSARAVTLTKATQGHRYRISDDSPVFPGRDVLCLVGGDRARVALIDEKAPWPLTRKLGISASSLQPLPMRYFNGEVPR